MPNADPAASHILKLMRSGSELTTEDIDRFIDGVHTGRINDVQFGAFCTSIVQHGLRTPQAVALARALARTGQMIDWSDMDLTGPVLGMMHNGGLGDISSLVIGPMIAACGGFFPSISSRSSIGSMSVSDRLSAIPGLSVYAPLDHFKKVVRTIGWSICAYNEKQLGTLLQFNRVRNLTGTTDAPILMTMSYLSRYAMIKVDGLAVFMRCGPGCMLRSVEEGQVFGALMRDIGGHMGIPNVTLVARAIEPAAPNFGAILEIKRAIDYLGGKSRKEPQHALLMEIAGDLLVMARLARTPLEAGTMLTHALDSGLAAEVFNRMVAANGGPQDLMASAETVLPEAPVQRALLADRAGVVKSVDIGLMMQIYGELGGTRQHFDDVVIPMVGVSQCALTGSVVSVGEPLGIIHAMSEDAADHAAARMMAAFEIDDSMRPGHSTLHSRIRS